LKGWRSNWADNLSDAYRELYLFSEYEQIKNKALAWPNRLEQIKDQYKGYYN